MDQSLLNATEGAIAPPPGVTRNFNDKPAIMTAKIVNFSLFFAMVTLLIFGHLLVKFRYKKSFKSDDRKCQLSMSEFS
jgi:hypothetical protein